MPERVLLGWSGGKDCAMTLATVRRLHEYDVIALLTAVRISDNRVSIHGVRRDLIERQAESLGIRLHTVMLPDSPTNDQYEAAHRVALGSYQAQGVATVAYGDLFLEDIRNYRDAFISRLGMRAVYPLWGQDTRRIAHELIGDGFKAIVTCVDTTQLDASFVGRELDMEFLSELPDSVDPCGENGEFHTFVYDGPFFHNPIHVIRGELFYMDDDERFIYCDLM